VPLDDGKDVLFCNAICTSQHTLKNFLEINHPSDVDNDVWFERRRKVTLRTGHKGGNVLRMRENHGSLPAGSFWKRYFLGASAGASLGCVVMKNWYWCFPLNNLPNLFSYFSSIMMKSGITFKTTTCRTNKGAWLLIGSSALPLRYECFIVPLKLVFTSFKPILLSFTVISKSKDQK